MHNAIESLNGLLRGEVSAVETYTQALKKVDNPASASTLQEAQQCHSKRVVDLRNKIVSMGGQPSESSGGWGAFAKFMEGAATTMGETPSIDMLEEGEDHGLKAYRDEIAKCEDPAVVSFLQTELMPRQEGTHRAVSTLKKSLH